MEGQKNAAEAQDALQHTLIKQFDIVEKTNEDLRAANEQLRSEIARLTQQQAGFKSV
jgi:hypothetical protein